MIKNKKGLLILVVFLIVSYLIVSIIVPKLKEYKNTIFIGSNTKVSVKDGNIKIYEDNTKLMNQKVKLYFKKEFVDAYIFSKQGISSSLENVYLAYDKKGTSLLLENELIAHTNDISIKIKDSNTKASDKLNDVYNFAKFNNIILSENIELDYLNISTFDYESDGEIEYIYSVGLIENNNYKSYIFFKKGNEYILIDSEESSYDSDHKKFYFLNLIDFNNDSNYEFVVTKSMSEYGPDNHYLYNFDGNEFTKIGVEE